MYWRVVSIDANHDETCVCDRISGSCVSADVFSPPWSVVDIVVQNADVIKCKVEARDLVRISGGPSYGRSACRCGTLS